MDNKVKELAKALGKEVRNEDPIVYIASPFFDELSKEYVTCKENEFDGMRVPYYSPRQDGINFNEVSGELRSERIKAIFKNNIRNLKKCEHICVNLIPCNGKIDIGTLWELGFFIGYHGNPNFDTDEYSTLLASPEVKDLINEIIKNLTAREKHVSDPQYNEIKDKKALFIKNASLSRVKDSMDLMDLNYEVVELPSVLSSTLSLNYKKKLFLIDEWPMQSFILMGYMYAKDNPYYTCSFKGYGSNVMIAASSKGHIQLPGLNDDTYNDNLK